MHTGLVVWTQDSCSCFEARYALFVKLCLTKVEKEIFRRSCPNRMEEHYARDVLNIAVHGDPVTRQFWSTGDSLLCDWTVLSQVCKYIGSTLPVVTRRHIVNCEAASIVSWCVGHSSLVQLHLQLLHQVQSPPTARDTDRTCISTTMVLMCTTPCFVAHVQCSLIPHLQASR